jgi:hypothetical protein
MADDCPPSLSENDKLSPPRASDCASHSARSDSASLTAACAAVSSAARRCFGELGGEKVGDGDEGVGGSAVSFHTRCVTSLRPSAAARVSRSSSRVGSEPGAPTAFASPLFCLFGEPGGEHVGEGLRGVGGRLRSLSAAACIGPASPSRKASGPEPNADGPTPAYGGGGERASAGLMKSVASDEELEPGLPNSMPSAELELAMVGRAGGPMAEKDELLPEQKFAGGATAGGVPCRLEPSMLCFIACPHTGVIDDRKLRDVKTTHDKSSQWSRHVKSSQVTTENCLVLAVTTENCRRCARPVSSCDPAHEPGPRLRDSDWPAIPSSEQLYNCKYNYNTINACRTRVPFDANRIVEVGFEAARTPNAPPQAFRFRAGGPGSQVSRPLNLKTHADQPGAPLTAVVYDNSSSTRESGWHA